MDISIIISGNLTGFSRFYASPNANDIYNEAKFDFDYRNFLTFINAGEKAYAISFSSKVVAVSLITRILDSFRRPGILVVTALIPRYQLVSDTLNAQDKSAIYHLLNEINDKFYEKNFLNGMVNQNPAVLMQDYYSDILRNYTLISDKMQKAVNTAIEVNSPNKRIGYISTNEKDMPKYLSSLMRKSYNGYHHVFFADKAPQNIDEPAEEIVTYKVRISNDNRPIHAEVRLDDRIPTVSPQQGEKPISNQNYTYRQVLNGEAGSDIIATIKNDTIVLSFRFPREEKTIYFKFSDGANELPIPLIRPILVESNGKSLNLISDSCTFYGKEIYGLKTIKSDNPEYTIDSTSSVLDLQRCNNGSTVNVYVRRGWELRFDFRNANYPKTIILTNRYTHDEERFDNVRDSIHKLISGNKSQWDMEIVSDYYETIKIPATTTHFDLYRKKQNPTIQGRANRGESTDSQRGGKGARTQGIFGQQIRLSGGENDSAKEPARIEAEKKKRLIQYVICAIVAVICCIGGWWCYSVWNNDKDNAGAVVPDSTWVTKNVEFSLEDGSINRPEIEAENLALLDFIVSSNGVKVEDGDNVYSKVITFDPKNSTDSIIIKVSFNKANEGSPIILVFKKCAVNELREGPNSVILSVKNSELDSYRSLVAGTIPSDLATQVARLSDGDKDMRAYAMLLVNLKNEIDTKAKADEQAEKERIAAEKAKEDASQKAKDASETGSARDGDIRNGLDDAGISLDRLKEISPQNKAEKRRIAALRSVLGSLQNGKCPKNSDNLSIRQKQIVDQLIARYTALNALPASDPEKKKKLTDFSNGLKAKNDKGINSIFTAREALKVKP